MKKLYGFGFNGFSQISTETRIGASDTKETHAFRTKPVQICTCNDQWQKTIDTNEDSACSCGVMSSGEPDSKRARTVTDSGSELLRISASWDRLYIQRKGSVAYRGRRSYTDAAAWRDSRVNDSKGLAHGWNHSFCISKEGDCLVLDHRQDNTMWSTVVTDFENPVNFGSVAVGGTHILCLSENQESGIIDFQEDTKLYIHRPLPLAMKIKKISCGKEHALLLSFIGIVSSFGIGGQGQLGHGSLENKDRPMTVEQLEGCRMLDIAAGGWHSLCVSDIGDLYAWGWNERGQLGKPSKIVQECLSKSTDGSQEPNTTLPSNDDLVNMLTLPDLVNFDQTDDYSEVTLDKVWCGSRHSVALTETGVLYTWGWNDYGQLGHGDTVSRDSPTELNFFSDVQDYEIENVVCGYWNTFVMLKYSGTS